MCRHYGSTLTETHRHHIDSIEHDNCVLCLAEAEGPMTLERVASYFGISKERAYQIEKAAFAKLINVLAIDEHDLQPEPIFEPSPGKRSSFLFSDAGPALHEELAVPRRRKKQCTVVKPM